MLVGKVGPADKPFIESERPVASQGFADRGV